MTEEDIADRLLAGLRQDILSRSIRSGMARLDAHRGFLKVLDPSLKNASQLVWRVAQWVDVGWDDNAVVRGLLERFPSLCRGVLSLRDYAALRMAEGMAEMSEENADEAIGHFRVVLALENDLSDREPAAIAHYWIARCQRKKGEYDEALKHVVRARNLALASGIDRVAAVFRVLESWLCFQKGRHKEALKVLAETEAVLNATDDAVVLGNIQSTYGRVYRQEGRYDRAILHFTNAIGEYRKIHGTHPNLARTLANMAYVKRLVALEFRRKIDADVARRRTGGVRGSGALQARDRFEQLRDEAFAHLDEAAAIYRVHMNHRGFGTVHLDRGLLYLDNGALDSAGEEAVRAFALGEEKDDSILQARARILQCMVENSKLEEGIEEDPRRHAQAALDYIRDALEFARHTQNQRLLARAHTWHGLTLSNEFFNQGAAAQDELNAASSYLDQGFHDTAWEDLQVLKARLMRSNTVNETLRAWSQGAVGDRTFRQIADEFAEIIIPKVWELEGRKVARVATRLSISPKKVRRALIRAGLLPARSEVASSAK